MLKRHADAGHHFQPELNYNVRKGRYYLVTHEAAMREGRQDPEKLLQRVQEQERQEKRGKLKIYLGAAPGVGKTHTMLVDAIEKRSQGIDVVIGVAESHGRTEIDALLQKLEILPRQNIEYRGKKIKEFDLDAALSRHPSLILIDEMAHTNAPTVRHAKRWQDIKELLDRGIDVYTTLNVQHIESLNDVVGQIIHAQVKETVPDFMIEMAATIELVDLPPEDLLKRLTEGKIYFPKQAQLATEHFFRKGNLIALRELALRVTAERVGEQVLSYRQGEGISHIWPIKDKLMVCIGPGPESLKIIRATSRIATSLQVEWIAVNVDRPQYTKKQRDDIIRHLCLAERLGADTSILTGFDVVKEIVSYARLHNITTIVMWKNVRSRWRSFLLNSLADDLVRRSGEINVYIITGETPKVISESSTTEQERIPWKTYGVAVGVVILVTVINMLLFPYFRPGSLIMAYLLGVAGVALFGYTGPSVVASILSVLAYDFFFESSSFMFTFDIQIFFNLLIMLLVTQVISYLAISMQRQTDSARMTERHTAAINMLSKQLASTRGIDKLLEIAASYISDVFNAEIMVFLPEKGQLEIRIRYKTKEKLSAKELSVAQWVYELGQIAGRGTDTLPFSDSIYVPLLASQGAIGVLRVHLIDSKKLLTPKQIQLLESLTNQIALTLEADRLYEEARESQSQVSPDYVQRSLLESVSHHLRTPLIAVMGAASTLEMSDKLDAAKVKKIGKDIYSEIEQLNRLINNLLQMMYLEAESVVLQKEMYSVYDFISHFLSAESKKIAKRPIHLHVSKELPKVPFDSALMREVFNNLIDNAIKFTPPKSPIDISAHVEKDEMIISVQDSGPGIMMDEENLLFEKFYRGRMLTTERGLGLGLAICQRIIKAHGGKIWAENRKEGGASFVFSLPLYLAPPDFEKSGSLMTRGYQFK
jgi:two-component system sensor histidine kinase KdpD